MKHQQKKCGGGFTPMPVVTLNAQRRTLNTPKNETRIVSFFGEQLSPQLLCVFLARFFLCIILEPEIVAIVGAVFLFHVFSLRLSALVRFCFVIEYTIQAYVEVGAAGLAFVSAGHEFKSNRILAFVTPFHILSRRSLRRCMVFPSFPCD